MYQLGHLTGFKRFTDCSNKTWCMGNPTQGKLQKGINCYTTAEYTADPVTHYTEYDPLVI